MPRVCTVCAHSKRKEIDKLILEGMPYRRIASQIGDIGYRSIERHHDNGHITDAMVEAAKIDKIAYGGNLIAKVQYLSREGLALIEEAKKTPDIQWKNVLNATLGRLTSIFELEAKLVGKLQEQGSSSAMSISSPIFVQLQAVIIEATNDMPEVRQRIANALSQFGQ
jgi:hypothetical protein